MIKRADPSESLPPVAAEYIRAVVGKIGYTRRVRREVFQELVDHFTDALRSCGDERERAERARGLVEEFGDPKMLARMIRRGKKRCRPLWKKAIVRFWQAIGCTIAAMILYVLWQFTGQPTISVDYLARFNRFARPDIREEDNAWPYLERAMALYVPIDPNNKSRDGDLMEKVSRYFYLYTPADEFTDGERSAVDKWARRNEPAWQEFLAAGRKPYCWHELKTADGSTQMISVLAPSLHSLRQLARAGIWRAETEARQGKLHQAVEDSLAVIRVGDRLNYAVLVEGLVGISMKSTGHNCLRNLLSDYRFSSVQLAALQHQLEEIGEGGDFWMAMEAERLGSLDVVQRVFTEGGLGGGHIIPQRLVAFSMDTGSSLVERPAILALGVLHVGRDETVRFINDYFDRAKGETRLTPWQRKQEPETSEQFILRAQSRGLLYQARYAFPLMFLPDLATATDLNCQAKASHRATVASIALLRWRKDKGQFPQRLDELVGGGYLSSLPADPYSDGPLKYRRTEGGFILYSIGENFKDDGGDPNAPGAHMGYRTPLDIVYWPPPKPRKVAPETRPQPEECCEKEHE